MQKTARRHLQFLNANDILIVTNCQYVHTVKEQLSQIDPVLTKNILVEPEKKNTAPAIALALRFLLDQGVTAKETILVVPSDHEISPADRFIEHMKEGEKIAERGYIVTFGIKPAYPETGYGYIQAEKPCQGRALKIERFIEKPDLQAAQKYIEAGNVYWNLGIFMFQIQTIIEEFEIFSPLIFQHLEKSFEEFSRTFFLLPDISIDYTVMEKSKKTVVMPVDFAWSDIGSWDSIYDLLPKDSNQNGKSGDVVTVDTHRSLLIGNKRLIAAIGLEDMVVVETADAVLVAKRSKSQKVKEIVSKLRSLKREETEQHITTHRPWGNFTILEESERYKIKKITVHPKHTLSLQMHHHRSEHWVIVKGTAKVTIEGKETLVHENESIYVPKGSTHRVSNPGKVPLEIIETQVGEYLGEDDIVRFDDVYGRVAIGSNS